MRFIPFLVLSFALATQPSWADDTATSAAPADNASGFTNVDLDTGFTGKLVVVRVNCGRTDNNLLAVSAMLRNVTGRTVKIEVGTCYADAAGNWINGGQAGWLSFVLKPHSEFQYRSASLSDDASDYLVRIRTIEPSGKMVGVAERR